MEKEILSGIVVNPKIKFGKPVIKGTRIPVDLILGKLAGGMGIEAVKEEYGLTQKQILSALKYAAQIISQEEIIYSQPVYA